MSRFQLRAVSSGLGRSLLGYVVLIGLAVIPVASPPAEARDCAEGGNPPAISRSESDYAAHSLALSGRYAYIVSMLPIGAWVPHSRFEVFDVSESARRASIWIDPSNCVEAGDGFVYLGEWSGFRVLDVSDPIAPQTVGIYLYPTYPGIRDIAVDRTHAYLAVMTGLSILDVSDPTSPTPAGSVGTPEPARAVAVSGSYAYVAAGAAGLVVVDVSHPSSPSVAGACVLPGPAWDIAVRGSHAYVADGVGLQVLDVSRPAQPRLTGSVDTPADARRVAVSGARAYVIDLRTDSFAPAGGLRVIDIANPTHPVIVNSIVDVPIMEDSMYERHAEAACVSVSEGRVAVAGAVVHRLVGGDCVAQFGGCDRITGYLDATFASAYEPPPPCSRAAARMVGSPADGPARAAGMTIPGTFALRGIEPNPFNPETSIRFDVARTSRVRIQVYDAHGRLVRRLVDDTLPPGPHEVSWHGRGEKGDVVASGIYFVTMEAEGFRQAKKITLMK
jgi:hypothetical protein